MAPPRVFLSVRLQVHNILVPVTKLSQSVVMTMNIPTPHEVLRVTAQRSQSEPLVRTNQRHLQLYPAQQQQRLHRHLAHAQALDPIFHHRISKHLFLLGLLFTLLLQQNRLGSNMSIVV